jgi:hypothetical protein
MTRSPASAALLGAILSALLSACGAEVATTAATTASLQAVQVQQAKAQEAQIKNKLAETLNAAQAGTEAAASAAGQ